ncbi:MAG: type II toxin-antitoxin system RelE/ParE family toxin [Gemmataceae bacterium]|nr:type II toxin-antitoxin system RelE/ParE family toxin [Gemmataceae bacterium]
MLATMPEMGAVRSFGENQLADLRMLPVRGFEKHLVFYRSCGSGIEIVRVLHAARDLAALLDDGE